MSFLKQIDEYFKNRPKQDFLYVLIGIVLVVGFIFYYFIYLSLSNQHLRLEKEYKNILSQYNPNLSTVHQLKHNIAELTKKIDKQKSLLSNLNKKIIYYSQLANLLDFAEVDQYKSAKIVKNCVIDAKNEGLAVENIANTYYDMNLYKNNENIIKFIDIALNLKGNLKSFIKYMYKYENRKDLIRISEMNISLPHFYIKYSIYGLKK